MLTIHIEEAGYEQKKSVIQQLTLQLPTGTIIGLLGANGAGKSTIIQTLIGTIPYVKGHIELPQFGYVPERPILYEHFTLQEHIDFLVATVDQPKEQLYTRAYALCERFRLTKWLHHFPVTFSKGMQQKVMLVLAFAPTYALYIVDEPFMGLDPQAMRQFIQLIQEEKANGATIFMSTHALDTAEKICDSFLLLHEGKLLQEGTLQQMQQTVDESLLHLFDRMMEGATT